VNVMFMRRMTTALLTVGVCTSAWGAAPSSSAPQPATWMDHDVAVSLQNLPKTYTCDELWYKFRDMLLLLGAKSDFRITAQHCAFASGPQDRSPQVELHFSLAQALTAAQIKYATVMVVASTGTLEPNSKPHSFTKADCGLVQQINDLLLPAVPVTVVKKSLDCGAAGSGNYNLSIQTLTPALAQR